MERSLVPSNQNKVIVLVQHSLAPQNCRRCCGSVVTSDEFTKGWLAPYRDEASSFLCGVELKLASGPSLVISRAQSGTPQGPAGTTGETLDNNTLALSQQDRWGLDLNVVPVYDTQTRQQCG